MERLTNKREADAQREEYKRRLANGYPRNIPEERFLRLAAYEDTHMTPPDVMHMRMDMAILTALFDGIDVDRMREIVAAERGGRVVVLPCKLGDKIYRIQKYFNDATLRSEIKVKACIVGSVSIDSMMTDDMVFLPFDRIGKTVFFTREDAEKALEGMK